MKTLHLYYKKSTRRKLKNQIDLDPRKHKIIVGDAIFSFDVLKIKKRFVLWKKKY